MNIDTLKQMVTRKNPKLKQIHILWLCLNYVEENPSEAAQVGCLWNSVDSFIINTKIHGEFIERLPNTINRGFRCHSFKWKKTNRILRDNIPAKFNFKDFPDQLNWDQRSCPGFTKSTTETEAITWKYHELIPKKSKTSKSLKISNEYINKFISSINPNDLNSQQKIGKIEFNFTPLDNIPSDEYMENFSIFQNQTQNTKADINQTSNQSLIYPQFSNSSSQIEEICSPTNFMDRQNNDEIKGDSNQIREENDIFYQIEQFNEDENQEIDFLSTFDNNSDIELESDYHNDIFMISPINEFFY